MLNFCIYTIGNWILNFKRLAARTAVANLSAVCNRYLYWSNWKWISRREDLRRSLISPPKWLSNVHWISFTAQPFEPFQWRASTDPAAFAPTANGFIWTQGDRLNSATLQICGQIESKMPNDRVEITRLCQDTEVQWLLPARYSLSSNFSTLRVGDALDLSPFECITRMLSVWQLEAECPGSNLHVMLGVWCLHVWCSHGMPSWHCQLAKAFRVLLVTRKRNTKNIKNQKWTFFNLMEIHLNCLVNATSMIWLKNRSKCLACLLERLQFLYRPILFAEPLILSWWRFFVWDSVAKPYSLHWN